MVLLYVTKTRSRCKTILQMNEQKYSIGERVKVQGWASFDHGMVQDIQWMYHIRLEEYTWGYRVEYEGSGPGLVFVYVPEGYLRKVLKE